MAEPQNLDVKIGEAVAAYVDLLIKGGAASRKDLASARRRMFATFKVAGAADLVAAHLHAYLKASNDDLEITKGRLMAALETWREVRNG